MKKGKTKESKRRSSRTKKEKKGKHALSPVDASSWRLLSSRLSPSYRRSITRLVTIFIGVLLAILLVISGYREFFYDALSQDDNPFTVRKVSTKNPVNDYLATIKEQQDVQLSQVRKFLRPFRSTGNLTVHMLDVGHGDSIFITTPTGNTILIDGGYEDQARQVYNYIHALSYNYLDYAIATHPDADHIGGLDFVIKRMAFVNKVLDNGKGPYNGSPSDYRTYRSYRQVALDQESYAAVRHDMKLQIDDNLQVDVYVPYENKTYFNNSNDNSIIVKLVYGNVSFLFTGDCEIPCEERLLKKDIRADILKVPHHGDNDATSQEFLDAVQPKVAIISTGDYERFGHPHNEVLQRLIEHNITIYRTDVDGGVIVTSDGGLYSIQTTRNNQTTEASIP